MTFPITPRVSSELSGKDLPSHAFKNLDIDILASPVSAPPRSKFGRPGVLGSDAVQAAVHAGFNRRTAAPCRGPASGSQEVTLRPPGIAMADAAAEKRAANKFSRQNAALGAETTKFLREAKVLIVGLRGAGIERRTNQI